MRIDNIKISRFPIKSNKIKELENYLETMLKEGWELKEIAKGESLIFEKTNTKEIKYYVDVVSKLSYINKTDKSILEYEEMCKEIGWELIAQVNKIMILKSNINNSNKIHTDEEEKFNIIKSAIKKSRRIEMLVVAIFIALIALLDGFFFINIQIQTISKNIYLILSLLLVSKVLSLIVETIYQNKWIKESKRKLEIREPIEYEMMNFRVFNKKNKSKINIDYNYIIFTVGLFYISYGYAGQYDNFSGVLLLVILVTNGMWMNFVRDAYSIGQINKRKRNIAVVKTLAMVLLVYSSVTYLGFSYSKYEDNRLYTYDKRVTVEDFNDVEREGMLEKEYYNKFNKSFISTYYSEIVAGEKITVDYQVFESKYDFLVDYYSKKYINDGVAEISSSTIDYKVDYELLEIIPSNEISIYGKSDEVKELTDKISDDMNKFEEDLEIEITENLSEITTIENIDISKENIYTIYEKLKNPEEPYSYYINSDYILVANNKFMTLNIHESDISDKEVLEVVYNKIFK